MTIKAIVAIYAAKNRRIWGAYAARRYAEKRGALAAYRLACQLEAATRLQKAA